MKKILFFFLAALPFLSLAQDCSPFYAIKQGMVLGYEYYDAKEKKTASSVTSVTDVKKTGDAVEAELTMQMMDKSEKETFTGKTRVICRNDTLFLDVSSLLNPQMTQSFGKMEVNMSGDGMVLPNKLKAGQQLPDSHNEFRVGMNGMTIMNMTIDYTEQMVEAEEKVTTPAGTFDCFRISHVSNSKTALIKSTMKTVQWFAKGVGIVKTETFDKKGALESRMILTSFKGS